MTETFSGRVRHGVTALLAIFVLSACSSTVSDEPALLYQQPEATNVSQVSLSENSVAEASDKIAMRLIEEGYTVDTASKSQGILKVVSNDRALVDCGQFRQDFGGNRAEFPANSSRAIIMADDHPMGLLLRDFEATTYATIQVQPNDPLTATIADRQQISLTYLTADQNRKVWRNSVAVENGAVAELGDGSVCQSSGKLSRLVSG